MTHNRRERAFEAVKSAMRNFAEHPTATNFTQAERAWRELCRLDAVSFWRGWKDDKLEAGSQYHDGQNEE